jgi:hypothetical protein
MSKISIKITRATCWHCAEKVEKDEEQICLFETTNTFVIWGNKPWAKNTKFDGQNHPTTGDKTGFAVFHKACYADWVYEEQQRPL